jgi:DNA (cytosine-5)-methyltransferase 1
MQRHLFWSNFTASGRKFDRADIRHKNKISDFDGYEVVAASKIPNKRQALRNCVNPELGLHIFESAFK